MSYPVELFTAYVASFRLSGKPRTWKFDFSQVAFSVAPGNMTSCSKPRTWELDFYQKQINPGEEIAFSVRPEVLFRADELIVVEDPPNTTMITDLTINGDSQFVPPSPPSSYFSSRRKINLSDTCEKGSAIVFVVKNQSAMPVLWSARMFGRAVL